MIAIPENIDRQQLARIHALLDAYAAVGSGTLFLHETSIQNLSYAVWSWANERGHKIAVHIQSGGVECWDISVGRASLYAYPNKLGQLADVSPDRVSEAEKIKAEAAERIQALLGVSS